MGPLWSGQGTVPHTTVNDLLSTEVIVSPSGALVGAGEYTFRRTLSSHYKLITAHVASVPSCVRTCCCCVGRGGDCVAAVATKHSCYTDSTIATSIERGNGVGSGCSINSY